MSINAVGPYQNVAAIRTGAVARPQVAPAPTQSYSALPTPAVAPSGGAAATGGGLSLGRLAAWAGGAFGGFKLWGMLARTSPQGWVLGGVLAGGAFVGNKLYNMLTGQAPSGGGLGGGNTMKYASWAGGAFGAWKLLGQSMRGWPLAGVIAGGAFAGGWLYHKLTGR
jgi:hypothetical protein